MGLEYKIFPEKNLLFMKGYGILGDKDALETSTVFEDRDYTAGMNIYDCSLLIIKAHS